MHTCSCGREAEDAGNLCARCAALQALDLDAQASEKQIRDAYRVLVKVWHPDRFQADAALRETAEAKLKALNAAYLLLSSKEGSAERPRRTRPAARPAPAARSAPAGPGPRVRPRKRFHFPAAALFKFGVLACGLLVAGVFLMAMDSFFASDPTTGRIYGEMRAHVIANARQTAGTLWSQAGEHLHEFIPVKSEAVPVAAAADPGAQADPQQANTQSGENASTSQSLHRREPGASRAETVSLQPYITSGLTREEVIAVLGAPTASTDSRLTYGASELDFTNGKVSGWKIAASAPIRVKLWPDAPVDPDLTSFKVGSTKNEVLVVQGTPTLFSENTFGYGGSRVFFANDRVVSWKNDPATVPLRVAP
jgi:curved DNA-binding protein CbpA